MEVNSFFRTYVFTLSGCPVRAEFDGGFLSSSVSAYNIHNHAAPELIVVSKGSSIVDAMEHGVFRCSEGDVLMIPAGIYHVNRRTEQIYDRFCLRFYLPALSAAESGNVLNPIVEMLNENRPVVIHIPEVIPKLSAIREEMKEDYPESGEMIKALLSACFILIMRNCMKHPAVIPRENGAGAQDDRIKKIERFFSKRFSENVGIGDLAESLYLSPCQTNRILHMQYGQSFKEKLRATRIQQGRLMLDQTEKQVAEIALEVGYSSVAGFYSAFKKMFSLTPGEYREKRR